jgi:hypothetical protein
MSIESNKKRRERRRMVRDALVASYIAHGMTEAEALDKLDTVKTRIRGAHPGTLAKLLGP